MTENTNLIFNYLKTLNISIDHKEFEYQFSSHPDFPSLLAITDTLNFFNISNGALKVPSSEIDVLPQVFIAKLKKENKSFLSLVKKKKDDFIYTEGENLKKKASANGEFRTLWDDVILLIEKDNLPNQNKNKNTSKYLLLVASCVLAFGVIYSTVSNVLVGIFYVLPFVGLYLSIAALKDLFNVKSNLLDNICNASAFTDCNSIINSSKWKLFEKISYSDLSITFFCVQIVALFIMGITNSFAEYFFIQKLLLLASVPIIVLSLYYQKFVEKKWCPICLSIVGVLLLELGYIYYLQSLFAFSINSFGITLYLFISTLVLTIWFPVKSYLKKLNNLKEMEIKANRFKRNYSIFKNSLLAEKKYELPDDQLQFGNNEACVKIGLVTSPFCGYCTEPHYMFQSILKKYAEHINVSIIFNVNPEIEKLREITTGLINIKLTNGSQKYYEATDYWYETEKNMEKWMDKYSSKSDSNALRILKEHHEWCKQNSLTFTPSLFVNGLKFPKAYSIADLEFFIDELISDESYGEEKYKLKIAETEKL